MAKYPPLEVQYSQLLRDLRALHEEAIVRNTLGALDPEYVIEKMETLRGLQDDLRNTITTLRTSAITERRKRAGKAAA